MSSELIGPEGVIATAGAKLLFDVFGDTAKLIGKRLSLYAETGLDNLERVLKRAHHRESLTEKASGAVSARVIQHLLPEACFCEDEVQAEYLGGILASAKGPVARDDRAVSHLSLLSSLSTYQIRTHYLLYNCILRWRGQHAELIGRWLIPDRHKNITVAVTEEEFQRMMAFATEEPAAAICQHVFAGLEERGLIKGGLHLVMPDPQVRRQPNVAFRYFYPTVLGIELFMWGLGHGDQTIQAYRPELLNDETLPPTMTPLHIELGRVNW
ncbi:MAG: hypothetical protein H0W34_11525 [Pyrinomonadaceae bacterium]|nr:hypothetical protein [Chthoniobacterales bacterium]MBA3572574.1 hypothetical protein [Pyrinomonadaceae bacterium]